MKQYKLTAWPDLPPRFQKTTMRRVVSELSQRFVSVRDLARSSGASARDVEELISRLEKDGMLMTRADAAVRQPVRRLAPVVAGGRRARHGARRGAERARCTSPFRKAACRAAFSLADAGVEPQLRQRRA